MDETEPNGRPRRPGAGRQPPTAALEAAIDELRDEAARRHADPSASRQLADIIRRIVRQAHAEGLRAEQLVIAFHTVWNDLAREVSAPPEMRDNMLVAALITAFYEDHVTSRSGRAGF